MPLRPQVETFRPAPLWLDAGLVYALLLIFFSPPWHVFAAWMRVPELAQMVEVRRAASLLRQLADPFAPIADPIHRALQWRLLFPLLGHVLHLPPAIILAAPFLGAYAALALILGIARRNGVDRWTSCVGVVLIGATGWFFASTGWLGYFDSWLALCLIVISHAKRRLLVWLACLLAPWIDERLIIALPIALTVRWLNENHAHAPDETSRPHDVRVTIGGAVILAVAFFIIRMSLTQRAGSLPLMEYLRAQQTFHVGWTRHLLGLWESLRLGWILVLIGATTLLRSRPAPIKIGVIALFLGCSVVSIFIANDLSRSMILLLPLAVTGLAGVMSVTPKRRRLLGLLAVGALAMPAQHVVTDFTMPILRLSGVLQARARPAGLLAASTWVETATKLAAQGKRDEAVRVIDAALRLDARCAEAYNLRGYMAAEQGEWKTAFENFAKACSLAPADAGLWLRVSYAAWKIGDVTTRDRALAEAKRLAKPESDVSQRIATFEGMINATP